MERTRENIINILEEFKEKHTIAKFLIDNGEELVLHYYLYGDGFISTNSIEDILACDNSDIWVGFRWGEYQM